MSDLELLQNYLPEHRENWRQAHSHSIRRKALAGGLLLLAGCTSISGPCTREVKITTNCEPGGTVIVLPGQNG